MEKNKANKMLSVDNKRNDNFKQWYSDNQSKYQEVAAYIKDEFKSVLDEHDFVPAYISTRAKSINSACEKAKKLVVDDAGNKRCKYTDPKNEIMDFAGVRVVVYLQSDLKLVTDLFEKRFRNEIIKEDSENKLEKLGKDRVGYLSVHYVLRLNPKSDKFKKLKNLKCEVQIRTILEDAWSQVFHDRLYKCNAIENGAIDQNIERKVNLISGSLELIDYNIDELAHSFDVINGSLSKREFQNLLDEEVNEVNLIKYFNHKFNSESKSKRIYSYDRIEKYFEIFEISTLRDLDRFVSSELILRLEELDDNINVDRVVRYILLIYDYNLFFENINEGFNIDEKTYNFLNEFINMEDICNKYNIFDTFKEKKYEHK